MEVDKLKLLRNKDYKINDRIYIRNPTLGEIEEYGEKKYFSVINRLITIPSDMKSVLFDVGIDYEVISEFELFMMLSKTFKQEDTKIILKNIDLSSLCTFTNHKNGQMFLGEKSSFLDEITILEGENLENFIVDIFNKENKQRILELIESLKSKKISLDSFKSFFDNKIFDVVFPKNNGIVIDMHIYILIADYIRKMHEFEKKVELSGNANTKKIMIDLDREDIMMKSKDKFESMLEPLIIAMVNCADFKYNFHDVWSLSITTFMKSVNQIRRLKHSDFMKQGIYSGAIDKKKINKKELNWI